MPITPLEAADVAKKHRLTLSDARALAAMAESVEDADTLAAKFAPSDPDTDADGNLTDHAADKLAQTILERGGV